jgi:hypothetical protein
MDEVNSVGQSNISTITTQCYILCGFAQGFGVQVAGRSLGLAAWGLIRPALSGRRRCLETAGMLILKGSTNYVDWTFASARMARR